ncbi:hypothetical protein [Burkholderia gladioli]|uniref:hypothetical protein n=1 Tax=Burkholderia gladioli TaxID=28095 RepID=UPI00163F82B5|nr:hypothetical protein [Burkholderia gladioli]
MTGIVADAWAYLKNVPNIVGILAAAVTALIASTVALFGAVIAARVSLHNSRKALEHAKETLDVQRATSARSAASFIADKRQKWIDELRSDMATHLAESQEIAWKWDATRQRAARVMGDQTLATDGRATKVRELAEELSKTNGDLDRSHQERHHRLRFRLNPKESDHQTLRSHLDEMREILEETRRVENREVAIALLDRMEKLVQRSDVLTNTILKTEWERVKQEVAYPAEVIEKIPRP